MKDKLQKACRILGRADKLIIITKNLYGAYSTDIKKCAGQKHRNFYAAEHLSGMGNASHAALRKA